MSVNNLILILICLLGTVYAEQAVAQCDFIDAKTGSHYIGECKSKTVDNKTIRYPDGKGKQTNSDGSYFVGTFSNGQRLSGTYYFTNGQRIENAVYENDKLHSGTYIYPSGAKYEGTFINDKFEGKGVYTYRDGSDKIKYEGDFERGKFNGEGTLTYRDNSADEGLWKDDIFLGAEIGVYLKQPVLKKGDTIITKSNNNKYLLSQQTIMKNDKYQMEKLNESIFAIEKDVKNNRKLIGHITAKTVLEKTKSRKRYEFQEIPVEDTIGVYKKQPVLKKGDTIITKSNNNKYLLSSQIIINQDNTNSGEYGFIYPDGSFYIIDRTVNSNKNPTVDTKNAIGYISFSEDFRGGEKVKSNFKFTEFVCDTLTYKKFLKFCDWQICKMINTANVFDLSLQDYSKDIQKDINLNFEIAGSKFKDILVNISSDVLDLFFYNKVKSLGKDMQNSNIEKALGIDSKTTVYSYFLHFICKSNNDICNAITSCALSYYKATHPDDNLNASISDYIKNLYRSDDAKAREKSLERTFSLCLKFLRDCIDGLPVGLKLKIFKQYYPYYIAGKNIIELGEITGFLLANVSIKFSVEPEYMEYLKYGIDNATKQKPILEKCKKEYEQKFKSATGNCLEYMKLLYSLKSGDFERQCGHNELQGITDLMKKYVFGNEEIPQCNILKTEELKRAVTETQLQTENKKNDKIQIGTYKRDDKETPVYYQNNIIFIEDIEYILKFQPFQKKIDKKLKRYFLIYQGKENIKGELKGWINYEELGYKFEQYYGNPKEIPGLNYFGSVYIGTNNPFNPDGTTPNYEIPPQDNVDSAALKHDKCYDSQGLSGANADVKSINCDEQTSIECFSIVINNYNKNILNNSNKFLETLNFAGYSLEVLNVLLPKLLDKDMNFLYRQATEKERALLVGFLFADFANLKPIIDKIAKNATVSQKFTFSKTTTITSLSGENYEVEPGDYYIGDETEMKGEKIVAGKIYDKDGKVKHSIFHKRNH